MGVNRAIHYNEWADFSKADLEPVVKVFGELLGQFRCHKCDSLLYVTPRKNPEDLRCACAAFRLNLKTS